ncbi:MAG TPA: class I SAM-dependent methyltransferase, partial [Propionibacterium sp.]|nr:class I SAM-dependent methyltransferase [Propionibacterium sp.]
ARAGWRVEGFDLDATAPARFAGHAPADLADRVRVNVVDLATAPPLPACGLVHASFALPYVGQAAFPAVWVRVVEALRPGGWFVGQLFGVNDSFNDGSGDEAFLNAAEAAALFDGWRVHRWAEEDADGPSFDGSKHWHVFHVVAQRPDSPAR